MKIDKYISELLYDNDCVIVTDLGGFITRYQPASINTSVNTISPPSKKVAFNASLKTNDGLLAKHISHKESLNYSDAARIIENYASEAKNQMNQGRRLKIEKVGILYLDKDQKIQFLPDQNINYLIDSFGLTPVHAPVVRRNVPATETELISIRKTQKPSGKTGREIKIFKWKVLEVIPAAAALALLLVVPPVLDRFNTNMSSLVPFVRMNEYIDEIKGVKHEPRVVNIEYPNPFEIPPANSHKQAASEETASTENIKTEELNSDAEVLSTEDAVSDNAVTSDTDINASAENVNAIPVSTSKEYYVIGGSFRSFENAQKQVEIYSAQNIPAEIIGKNKSGLHLVSLFHSGSYNESAAALSEIKSATVPTAWIYRK